MKRKGKTMSFFFFFFLLNAIKKKLKDMHTFLTAFANYTHSSEISLKIKNKIKTKRKKERMKKYYSFLSFFHFIMYYTKINSKGFPSLYASMFKVLRNKWILNFIPKLSLLK
ncbi:hypothetical protein HMI54_010703 [Coelomomyces lativittatus]|nr:hypothetical protein HMI54_010703 [Coelomomyces lativittatus]